MADSLGDLLPKDRFQEPPEIKIIKSFVKEKYNYSPEVTIQTNQIVIGVNSAALAGTLRMDLHKLAGQCSTDKRLIIRMPA